MELIYDSTTKKHPQVVVMLSRTRIGKNVIIVGNLKYAIERMYDLITQSNQVS